VEAGHDGRHGKRQDRRVIKGCVELSGGCRRLIVNRRSAAAAASGKQLINNTDTHNPIPPPTNITTGHKPAATPPVGRSQQGIGSTDPAQPVERKKVKEGELGCGGEVGGWPQPW
jgi:hypothetical protein